MFCRIVAIIALLYSVNSQTRLAFSTEIDDVEAQTLHLQQLVIAGEKSITVAECQKYMEMLRTIQNDIETNMGKFVNDWGTLSQDKKKEYSRWEIVHRRTRNLIGKVLEIEKEVDGNDKGKIKPKQVKPEVANQAVIDDFKQIQMHHYKEWIHRKLSLAELSQRYMDFISRHKGHRLTFIAFRELMLAHTQQYETVENKKVPSPEVWKIMNAFCHYCDELSIDIKPAVRMPKISPDWSFPCIFNQEVAFCLSEYPFYQSRTTAMECQKQIIWGFANLRREHFLAIFHNMVRHKWCADTSEGYRNLLLDILKEGNKYGEHILYAKLGCYAGYGQSDYLENREVLSFSPSVSFSSGNSGNKNGSCTAMAIVFSDIFHAAMRLKFRLLYEQSADFDEKLEIAAVLARLGDDWGADSMVNALAGKELSEETLKKLRFFYPIHSIASDGREIDWLSHLEKAVMSHDNEQIKRSLLREVASLRSQNGDVN